MPTTRVTICARFRRLAPANRWAYECWDLGIGVAVLAALWYVISEPSGITDAALRDTLNIARLWGIVLVVGGLAATGLSYSRRQRTVEKGFISLVVACGLWCAYLLISTLWGSLFSGLPWEMSSKALGVAWVFGMFTARAFRDGTAAAPDDHTVADSRPA